MTSSDNSPNPVASRRDLMKAVGLGLAAAALPAGLAAGGKPAPPPPPTRS